MANELKFQPSKSSVRSPDHKLIYTNAASVSFSPWDLSLNIGQMGTDGTVTEIATITMSPQHAKVLLKVWDATLKQFEGMFGEIADPTSVIEAHTKQSL